MIDITAAVRTILAADAGVAAQVGTRVYASPGLPRSEADDMPRKAIVFMADGGRTPTQVPEATARLQFRCYGATSVEAWAAYAALFEALHRKHHSTTAAKERLLTAYLDSGPVDAMEPEVEWPCVLCYFVVQYVREVVT